MARVRYSRAEAEAEVMRRAEALMASRPDRDQFSLRGAIPDGLSPLSRASKHPVVWSVVYAPILDGATMDGGELFVIVDLELSTIHVRSMSEE